MGNYHLSIKRHSYTRVWCAFGLIEFGFCAISEGKIAFFWSIGKFERYPEAKICKKTEKDIFSPEFNGEA